MRLDICHRPKNERIAPFNTIDILPQSFLHLIFHIPFHVVVFCCCVWSPEHGGSLILLRTEPIVIMKCWIESIQLYPIHPAVVVDWDGIAYNMMCLPSSGAKSIKVSRMLPSKISISDLDDFFARGMMNSFFPSLHPFILTLHSPTRHVYGMNHPSFPRGYTKSAVVGSGESRQAWFADRLTEYSARMIKIDLLCLNCWCAD